jgi:hypothetical protein
MQLHGRLEALGGLALGFAVAPLPNDWQRRGGRLPGGGWRALAGILLRTVLLHPPLLHLHLHLQTQGPASIKLSTPQLASQALDSLVCIKRAEGTAQFFVV